MVKRRPEQPQLVLSHPSTRPVSFLMALLALFVTVIVATACDTKLVQSTPAAGALLDETPTQVVVWLDEKYVSGDSTLRVFDADGNRVDESDRSVNLDDPNYASIIVSVPALPDGTYTVKWRATLSDEHSTNRTFTFTIDSASTTASQDSLSSQDDHIHAPMSPVAWIAVAVQIMLMTGMVWFLYQGVGQDFKPPG